MSRPDTINWQLEFFSGILAIPVIALVEHIVMGSKLLLGGVTGTITLCSLPGIPRATHLTTSPAQLDKALHDHARYP